MANKQVRRLAIVLGDQLNRDSALFDNFDPERDAVWMAEVAEESTHVWTHKARIALFLSAMRHFRDLLRDQGLRVEYTELDDSSDHATLADQLARDLDRLRPERLLVVWPGEWRVKQSLEQLAKESGVPLDVLDDTHFYSTPADFAVHAKGRKQLRLEFFYRELRKKHAVLMTDGAPVGGEWNYDSENRGTFGKQGPGEVPPPPSFTPDRTTQQVLALVQKRFASHPGLLEQFDWPVTAAEAQQALDDFVAHRLPHFGDYQDAMWTDEPFLYHSLISSSLNLKLLNPRQVVSAAEAAYHAGTAPLNAVEGFIRQILGWREYVRGIYWHFMPDYIARNTLGARAPLPDFYWTGETDMHCLSQVIGQTLDTGYAHHIQRLMVTGLFALLLGVEPREVHQWYLAVYVDAVEWVELPNTLGMSQYADDGVMASKPYCASGNYINRMSNYCKQCRYRPGEATGERACPFTTLYWDFLARHNEALAGNPRMTMQLKNLERKSPDELQQIRAAARAIHERFA
jgi:deoxyribodipyrimidine photolyase-related protein